MGDRGPTIRPVLERDAGTPSREAKPAIHTRDDMDIPGYDSWKLDAPPRFEDAVPPDPSEDDDEDADEDTDN